MDNRINNGGSRKGSGRKPKADELLLIERLTPLHEKAFEALEKGLTNGEFAFIKLFFEYAYGKPKQITDLTINNSPGQQEIKVVIVRPLPD